MASTRQKRLVSLGIPPGISVSGSPLCESVEASISHIQGVFSKGKTTEDMQAKNRTKLQWELERLFLEAKDMGLR